VNEWPTDIVFSGDEVGGNFNTGSLLSSRTPAGNPVRRAYELFLGPKDVGRASWDLTAAYFAVHGSDGVFTTSVPGKVTIDANGRNVFTPGSSGRHRYLKKVKTNAEITTLLDDLLIQTP